MDPSALIFVALAVAWAVYLIPKALEHHEAGERSRSISSFSHRLRVLGRRDAVSRRRTALVTTETAKATPAPQTTAPAASVATPASAAPAAPDRPVATRAPAAPRSASARAARRRRNVLGLIMVVLLGTVVAAVLDAVSPTVVAVPVVLLVAWLVACRLMVRKERAVPVRRRPAAPVPAAIVEDEVVTEVATVTATVADEHATDVVAAAEAEVADSSVGRWDPVDVPLPTYVSKPAAHRTVRTIDLDSTGVWSSGRNEADSALAREADASRQAEPTQKVDRKTGS